MSEQTSLDRTADLPWRIEAQTDYCYAIIDANDAQIATVQSKGKAAYIVKAANAYPVLEKLAAAIQLYAIVAGGEDDAANVMTAVATWDAVKDCLDEARARLSEVEGKP